MKEFINVKDINSRIVNGLINKWGTTKFVKVIISTAIGAGFSAWAAESLIPNEPEILKEKEIR